jgi:hypothetical protein
VLVGAAAVSAVITMSGLCVVGAAGVVRAHTLTLGAPTDPDAAGNNGLQSVSCPRTTDCIAVGYKTLTPSSTLQTLAERWNGTTWSSLTTPNVGTGSNELFAVSCSSPTFCVAAGEGGTNRTLLERWNGTT